MADEPKRQNTADVNDNVLTIKIYLDNPLAMALGSLEMAKDLAKAQYMRMAQERAQNGILHGVLKPH